MSYLTRQDKSLSEKSLVSVDGVFSSVLWVLCLIQDARKNTIHTRDFSESYLGESFDWNRKTGNVQ